MGLMIQSNGVIRTSSNIYTLNVLVSRMGKVTDYILQVSIALIMINWIRDK